MMLSCNVKVEKVPALTCKKCGSIRVMMTDKGPECSDCGTDEDTYVELSREVEYSLYQINQEMEKNEVI